MAQTFFNFKGLSLGTFVQLLMDKFLILLLHRLSVHLIYFLRSALLPHVVSLRMGGCSCAAVCWRVPPTQPVALRPTGASWLPAPAAPSQTCHTPPELAAFPRFAGEGIQGLPHNPAERQRQLSRFVGFDERQQVLNGSVLPFS